MATCNDYEMVHIERWQVERIKKLSERLFTENRMNGDEMRDWAEKLRLIVEDVLS